MNEETRKEIIKAFAYGCTEKEVSEAMSISAEDAAEFREDNASAILAKKAELREAGYLNE